MATTTCRAKEPAAGMHAPAKLNRRLGREAAMQILYQYDFQQEVPAKLDEAFLRERIEDDALVPFARRLIQGVRMRRQEIDALLQGAAENWTVGRMAAVDRNILRLAVFELKFCEGVPPKVAINEALEIAKRFSTAESVAFINGILDRIANLRGRRPQVAHSSADAPAADETAPVQD